MREPLKPAAQISISNYIIDFKLYKSVSNLSVDKTICELIGLHDKSIGGICLIIFVQKKREKKKRTPNTNDEASIRVSCNLKWYEML